MSASWPCRSTDPGPLSKPFEDPWPIVTYASGLKGLSSSDEFLDAIICYKRRVLRKLRAATVYVVPTQTVDWQ